MNHADTLDQLEEDIMDVQGNTEDLENRTAEIERDVFALEDKLTELDARTSDIEQVPFGKL